MRKPTFIFRLLIVCAILLVLSIGAYFALEAWNARNDLPSGSSLYLGKNGDYLVQEAERNGVQFYDIHISVSDPTGSSRNIIYPMRNPPASAEQISVSRSLRYSLFKPTIFITQDPSLIEESKSLSIVAATEFGRVLGKGETGVYQDEVFYTHTLGTPSPSLQIKTCKDVSADATVILLRSGNSSSVTVENDCVIVQGANSKELILAADALAYYLLSVF
ncbi:MAG: hypothetical protein AABX05_05390 [Nanoarchaeota archaeon]